MIDIEPKVYTTVRNAIKSQYATADVAGDYIELPEKFPHINIVQVDSYIYGKTQVGTDENHDVVIYQLDVYCVGQDRKAQAKAILSCADSAMLGLKFTRLSATPTPNIDRTVYRITARYSCVVAKGYAVGADTKYQIYRQ